MTEFTPTAEQQRIIDAATQTRENIMIRAYAGCSKTTTLKLLAAQMRPEPALAIAFNKKIAKELEAALPSFFMVKTLNGLGHQALARALTGKRLVLEDRKIGKLITELFKEEEFEAAEDEWVLVRDWVNAARQAGIVHASFERRFPGLCEDTRENWDEISNETEPSEQLYEFARETLRRCIVQTLDGIIDFDDQIFGSVLLGGVYPKFPLVLVDEAQDLSPLNHEQIRKVGMARLIVVGDPKQAIYSFRGADSRSMDKLRSLRDSWLDLPLHTTFRCPKIIVKRSAHHAPGFNAFATNEEGKEVNWLRPEKSGQISWKGEKHDGWSFEWLRSLRKDPGEKIFILCRNKAPLLSLAFKLIRQGIGPNMLGRDLGQGLERLLDKITEKQPGLSIDKTAELIEKWRVNEESKARLMDREHLISGIEDRAECLLAVMENPGVHTAGDLTKALKALFSREFGEVSLATGHRAKGLEAEIVVHLDPWRIPSRFAMQDPSQMEQERNLKYVLETRTKRVFVEANLEDFV